MRVVIANAGEKLRFCSQLSGKKWDKATKNLTKNNLVKVEKVGEEVLMGAM